MATTKHTERLPVHIELLPATPDQEPILANLLELYIHDFSEIHHVELGPDGRFGYKNLPLYWLQPHGHPFLVQLDSKLAGFILIKRGSEISGNETVWDMAEFFILRGCRRRGVGTEIAHQVWRQFPGPWEIRVMESNHSAARFWEHAIAEFTGAPTHCVRVEKEGKSCQLFSFESKRVS